MTNLDENKHIHNHPFQDITVGSNHGAEMCELIGLYLMENTTYQEDIRIYRDVGLTPIPDKTTVNAMEKLTKTVHEYEKSSC